MAKHGFGFPPSASEYAMSESAQTLIAMGIFFALTFWGMSQLFK
jgi:hypothetical protein